MVRWSRANREANKAAREQIDAQNAQDEFNDNVEMNTSRAHKRSVDSPPTQITKSRRSNRKKANTGASPIQEEDSKIAATVNAKNNTSINDSFASQESTKPLDILREQHSLIMTALSLRLPSLETSDSFLHAIAIMLDVKINFITISNEVKEQMMEDFIYVLSDPDFKRNTLYTRHNMVTLAMFVTIPPVFPPHLTARNLKNNVDKLLQEIIQKKGPRITIIPNLGWTEMCKLTGIFLSPNSIEDHYKLPLVKKILSAIRQSNVQNVQWFNKHALSQMAFYFGIEIRNVANNSMDYMVPPFYTDTSFEAEFRRNGYYAFLDETEGVCPDFKQFKSLAWCASGIHCQVDIFDASNIYCVQCAVPVHPQCSSLFKKEYYCFTCHPDRSRHSWYCHTGKYIELPLARAAPKSTVNNEDDSQAMSEEIEFIHTEHNVNDISGENEFDDVNDASEINRDVNQESDDAVVNDNSSIVRRLNLDDPKAQGRTPKNSSPKAALGSSSPVEHMEFNPPDPLQPSYTSYYEQGFFISRIDLTITIKINENETRSDEEKFIDAFKIFFARLLTIDEKITVLPWKEFTNLLPLDIENLNPDFDDINVYFNRARVLEDNLKVYCDARIKHEMVWDAITISMRHWLQTNETGMYYKKLQVESTRILGWMLWSHRHIKVDRLAHVLANDNDLHLSFRYSKIFVGKGEKFTLNEGVKAIYVVCDTRDFDDYSAALKIIYHQSVKNFPLGIKLRFMPQVMNADEDLLIMQQLFRAQQEQFLAKIITASSNDIRLLDAQVGSKKTLRNVIMNLKHPETGRTLFLTVDTQWNNSARHIFAFKKSHEKHAIRMVNTLAAYLTRIKQNDVLPYFTVEAIERSKKLQWDEKRQCIMTMDEIFYHDMDLWEDAEELDLDVTALKQLAQNTSSTSTNGGNVAAQVANIEAKSTRVENIHAGEDACSIGTVSSKAKAKRMTGKMESDSERDNSSVGSISTTASGRSSNRQKDDQWERRLSVITANQNETNRNIGDLTGLLHKIIGLNFDKTIRVEEPEKTTTNSITPAAGDEAANKTTKINFATGSTTASVRRQASLVDWCNVERRSLGGEGAEVGTPTAITILPQHTIPRNNIRSLQQTRLDTTVGINEPWGDSINTKRNNVIRIGFRNIRSLPADLKDERNKHFSDDIPLAQLDIYGVSEVNLAWHKLSFEAQPTNRFRSLFEKAKIIACNNRTDPDCQPSQRGGTLLGIFNDNSHRVIDIGFDKRNLGRWCWTSLQGANDIRLLVVSVYRPCHTTGATTIYSQQRRLLQQTGISICPRIQFWNDLRVELQDWTDQGYNIVIGGDFNQPVGEHSIKEFFQDFGMRESITTIHTNSTAPGTHKKGSTPIDGIFCTASLTIKACGYTPVKWGIFTDHRLIWVDICAVSALGHNAPRLISPKARKLQVDNPDIVYRYLCHRLQLMTKNKLFERTQALYDKVVGGARDINTIIELEKLDTIRTRNMLEAEQRCRKIKAGNVAWSPIFQHSINLIRYLRVLIRKLKGHDVHSRTLYKLHQRLETPCLVNTLVEAEAKLMEELSEYRSIKTEAVSKRQSFLENLAITKADKVGVDYDTMLKQLKLREYQRSLASQLKRLKGSFMQGLNEIEETHDDSTIFLRDKSKIEKACATEGKRRFTQAASSPSLLPSQIDLLGWTADTDAADSILKGEIPEGLHDDIAHIVSFLQKPPNILHEPEINCLMSSKEFAQGWKRSKEHTSSGMSGLHFGHFKADLEHEKTLQINHQLLQMAIILGYSMLRWQRAIDVMIPKKSNSKRVEKLRVICLMEADFNFMNKWMGKITMKRAESCHTIAAEQFGSRKNKSAILHAFNKALCFDYLRITRTNASLSVLDAKACYDRIPPPLACLCLRRQGLPQNIIDASFNTIKDMKHHIRTAFGVSKLSYDRGDDYMHGILQGNGAGPCIWVMLSSPLLDKLKSDGFGVTLNVPDQEPLQVVGFAFVDDVDIIQVLPDEDPIPIVQEELDSWRQGLNTASGALEWSKCDVYLLIHKWNMKTSLWQIASMEQCPGDIFINDNGEQRALRRQEPHKATLSLGVQFAPDGSMKDEVTHLRKKAELWADLLRVKKMQRDAVWYSLIASIMKTIEYPLLATSISQAQFQYIMAPILVSALPRAGICRYMNRDVIYSLPLHQGMGIPDPFVTQGLRKLFELLHEPCKANPSLPFLSSALSSLATFSGLGPNFLLYPPTKRMLGMIDNSLCRSLWEFLHVYGIQVKKLVKCDKQFDQDEYIMERIYASSYSTADLRIFNYCRIFLQVSRLSEIILMNGKGIRRHILEGHRVRHVIDKTCWFDQPCPAKPAWNKFRNMLASVYSTNQNGIFVSQLNITSWNRSRWKWFYCPDTSNLFEVIAHNKYLSHAILHHHNRRSERSIISFSKTGYPSDNIPTAATPVTVFLNPQSISMDSRQPLPKYRSHIDIPLWTDHLQIQQQGGLVEFEQEYLKNNLILVSDGSYKTGVGSAAWIITSKQNQKIFIKGQCPTMGHPDSQDSHRSELFGILGGIFLLRKYILSWNQPIGTITVGCDNTSAIAYAFDKYKYPVAMSSYPDFDVIQSIRSLCLQCVNYVTLHIPGHQDDYIGPYDFESTLNIQMDSDAKRMRKTKTPLTDFVSLPNQIYQLSFNSKYICKQLQSSIREGISSNTMQKYWNKKSQVESTVFPLISWQEVGKAMKQNKPEKRHWLVKHATGNCGVNAILVHRKKKESPNCLRCREYEDSIHVWKCQHHTTSELWDNELEELRLWLVSANTSPYIIESLIGGLKNWYSGSNLRPWCPLIKSQHLVGWNNIILGRFHQTWQETQHDYLIAHYSKKSASAWLTKLILQIWKIAWKLWLVRNEYEHEHDTERRNIEFSNSIEVEIAIGFDNLPNSHRQMFSENEITYLRTKARLEYKRQWLENIKACRFAQTSASIQTPIVYNAPMPV